MASLDIAGLRKTYVEAGGRRTIFRALDLQVGAGEVVALLGASGSGKTTLLNLISGIDAPDGGSIRIGDIEVTALAEPHRTLFRRRHIGFVFQFFNLIPTLTLAENLGLPLELIGTKPAEGQTRIRHLLDRVGLGGRPDSFPERLSGGEQQRAAVARALAHRPQLILADEPTGNLDRESGIGIMELLADLAREHGTTVLTVTHSETVAARCDRALRLADGELLAA
jgi:putative ABC transport system ATP-binding protein